MFIRQQSKESIWSLTVLSKPHLNLSINMSFPAIMGVIFLTSWSYFETLVPALVALFSYFILLFSFELTYFYLIRLINKNFITEIEITAFGAIYKNIEISFVRHRRMFLLSFFSLLLVGFIIPLLSSYLLASKYFIDIWYFFVFIMIGFNLIPAFPTKIYLMIEQFLRESKKDQTLSFLNKFSLYTILILSFVFVQIGNILLFGFLIILAFYSTSRIQVNKFVGEMGRFNLKDLIIPRERLLCFSDLMNSRQAVYLAVNSFQECFPVLSESKFIGLITKNQLIKNLALSDDQYLKSITDKNILTIKINQDVQEVAKLFVSTNSPVLPVIDEDNNFIGLIVKDKISEYELVMSIDEHHKKDQELEF